MDRVLGDATGNWYLFVVCFFVYRGDVIPCITIAIIIERNNFIFEARRLMNRSVGYLRQHRTC